MSPDVERVARVIWTCVLEYSREMRMPAPADSFDRLHHEDKVRQLGIARAVIAELRDPSEAMLEAGGDLLLDGRLEIEEAEANARGVWRAMVDAMLAKPDEPETKR